MPLDIKIKNNKIYAPLKDEWLNLTEQEKLKQEFILRLINSYDYDLEQLGQDIEIKNKVKVDIAIWKNKADKKSKKVPSIIIAIECKAEHVSIKKDDILLSYKIASSVNANFFIATNLKETKVYHILQEPTVRTFDKLGDIPNAKEIKDDKSIEQYLVQTKTFTRDDFTKLLTRCHNIIRNNDKLSPEAAFDEISKILFMKIMYERQSKEELIFSYEKFKALERGHETNVRPSLKNTPKDLPYMDFWFERTKEYFEGDEIFDLHDKIKIKQGSFESIVKELEKYNLSDTSDDVKGIAFEEFLGKTFRGELGQFFTPRTIVDYMVNILDPNENETVCDPCCGSGGFLIKAFEYIREKVEKDIQASCEIIRKTHTPHDFEKLSDKKQDEIKNKIENYCVTINSEFNLQNKLGRLRKLSKDCIFGIDANPRMARTAKMNMIMHGDGHGGVHHHDGLLNVNGIYDGKFDVILTNPPFGARVDKSLRVTDTDLPSKDKIKIYKSKYPNYEEKVIKPLRSWAGEDKGKGKPIIELFNVGRMSGLTEVLFIERCINLLKPGGRMGIVLPDGVLNNPILQKVRDYIEGKAKIINITSIPQDVFIASGATVKPSLVFLKKFTDEEARDYLDLKEKVEQLVNKKYESQIKELNLKLEKPKKVTKELKPLSKDEQKVIKDKIKEIEVAKDEEIRSEIKRNFSYQIPIVEVEKAGISSTGTKILNELDGVAVEFLKYRKKTNIWVNSFESITYSVNRKGEVLRKIGNSEPHVFFKK